MPSALGHRDDCSSTTSNAASAAPAPDPRRRRGRCRCLRRSTNSVAQDGTRVTARSSSMRRRTHGMRAGRRRNGRPDGRSDVIVDRQMQASSYRDARTGTSAALESGRGRRLALLHQNRTRAGCAGRADLPDMRSWRSARPRTPTTCLARRPLRLHDPPRRVGAIGRQLPVACSGRSAAYGGCRCGPRRSRRP